MVKEKTLVITALITYMVMIVVTSKLMNLTGSYYYIFMAVMALLGAIALAAWLWFKSKRGGGAAAGDSGGTAAASGGGGEEVDLLVRDAEARLAASKVAQGASLGNLPLIFVVGEQGAVKTNSILHSGMEPELLAGQVYHETVVAPTRVANFWFARNAIFAEAGPRVFGDGSGWQRIIRKLKPGNLKSVMGGATQAPRAALVCVDAETFTRGSGPDQLAAQARSLQARLMEISNTLGISFPVYVLITKSDRIPYFAEYVRNLTNEEASQVLGVTLPMRPQSSTGVYAEEETQRLNGAFSALFHALADRRLDFLAREAEQPQAWNAYEFPREFRKLRGSVVQFLVDLGRPSQLRTSPFLRGFYFSGVRPVVVADAPVPAATPRQPQKPIDADATRMFSVTGAAAAQPMQAQYTGTKRVPQWLFLPRLFHQILLQDRVALGASGASTKTSGMQRVLLAAAAVLCLAYIVVATVSYFKNRDMVNTAYAAAQAISAAEGSGGQLPTIDALRRLEALRQSLEQITGYERQGAPLSMRWGLYTGHTIYPDVRRLYYNKFAQLMFKQSQDTIHASLEKLPSAPNPNDDYDTPYNNLKSYLITTSHHDKSTKSYLTPVLMNRWLGQRTLEADRFQLAQKQFDFYAEDLRVENPYSSEADAAAVDRARRYLAQFGGNERIYNFMLAEANKANPAVNYNKRFPGSAEVVINDKDVAGAFTKNGWAFMQNAIRKADQYFGGERWVLGDYVRPIGDRAKLEAELKARYESDFLAQWRTYLKNTTVVRYANLKDAARKLNVQSGNQSPILSLFWLASQNTGVDSPKVKEAFQPIHHVVPPESVDRYVAPTNQPYMNSLVTLQTSIEQASNAPGGAPDPATAAATMSNASQAKITVKQMAQNFRIDSEHHIETTSQQLLEAPIKHAEGLIAGLGPAELNAKGKGLCAQFAAVSGKFPFNPRSQNDATIQEVDALLKPGSGAFWQFYEANLKAALPGPGYIPNPASGTNVSGAFLKFFRDAVAMSRALYKDGSTGPAMTYMVRPLATAGVQNLVLTIDGQPLPATQTAGKQFAWPGTGARNARMTGKINTGDLPVPPYEGLWASFRLFRDAEKWEPAGSGYNLEWLLQTTFAGRTLGPPVPVRYYLDLQGAPPFFRTGLQCVSTVATAR